MKKTLFSLIFLLSALASMASPVRRGQWITITLADGREIRVEARGDENILYWQAEDGTRYVRDAATGTYEEASVETLAARVRARRVTKTTAAKRAAALRQTPAKKSAAYTGTKKGLIILVQFTNKRFSTVDPKTFYTKVANQVGFSEGNFNGSVHDYFLAQSGGRFSLDFDVVGPVTLPNTYGYYGTNDDAKAGEMVHDACVAVTDSVNFADYDWDNDGEAEEVFILYAGYGQADHSNQDSYIWPHMAELQAYDYYQGQPLVLDNTVVNVYACANEMTADDTTDGIGTICHEFSHCLGFPDLYDTGAGTNFGMGSWDLMDYGCYNDDGFTPAGYTGYEKMLGGWASPIVITTDTVVTGMKSISEGGESYIIYNPNNANEYYILDNRQLTGYDAALAGHGMIVSHIDYDEAIWYNNIVNATGYDAYSGINNNHQRATIFHADNNASVNSESGDTYPYGSNNSLSKSSKPTASLYNALADGTKLMPLAITGIKEAGDGTLSFAVKTDTATTGTGTTPTTNSEYTLLYETFDNCTGKGGNDGVFSGNIASAVFTPDLTGWSYNKAYGGSQCARFGNSTVGTGTVTTPTFTLKGDTATLSFRAAAWSGDATTLSLTLNGSSARFADTQSTSKTLAMGQGQWTDYELKIVGTGSTTLTFNPAKRFFLDDVLVERPTTTGIATNQITINRREADKQVYTIDGRKLSGTLESLPHGVYIVEGRKVVR